MSTLNSNCVIRRSDKHLETHLDAETVVMHIKSGRIYSMANTGQAVWGRLAEPVAFGELVAGLVSHFEIDPEMCARDVSSFLQELERLEFVKIDQPGA